MPSGAWGLSAVIVNEKRKGGRDKCKTVGSMLCRVKVNSYGTIQFNLGNWNGDLTPTVNAKESIHFF